MLREVCDCIFVYLLVDEEPAAGVHEVAMLWFSLVAFGALDHAVHLHLAWRQQINSRNRFVANGDLPFLRSDVQALETAALIEKSTVWCAHS